MTHISTIKAFSLRWTPVTAKFEAGILRIPINVEKAHTAKITMDFRDLNINVIAPRQISVELEEASGHMKLILGAIGLLIILGFLIWWRRT